MKAINNKLSGFSLVELLVVVTIVAVLSISSLVGFGYLGDTLKAREVTGFLADLIKQEELKVLRGDFDKAVVHFLPDFVVIDEQPDEYEFELELGGSCGIDGYYLIVSSSGNLTLKDENEEIMELETVAAGTYCIEPIDSPELEWVYYLSSRDSSSNTIRFIHFNLRRESISNPVSIVVGTDSRVEISSPYGKKRFYDAAGGLVKTLDLTVRDEDLNAEETLTFR